ncbi:MAG: 4Fe-4S binding protein [Chloroflexota bacterium]
MYVDETRCAGCGACLQVCPSDAIRLVNDCAQIDAARCNDCRACVEVCPSDAIITALPAIVPVARAPIPSVQATPIVETKTVTAPSRALAPAIGAALTFVGREIAPRVASAVVETMLNRAAERTRLQSPPSVRENRPRRLRRRARKSDR